MKRIFELALVAGAGALLASALPACDGALQGDDVATTQAALLTLDAGSPVVSQILTLPSDVHMASSDLQTADYGKRLLVKMLFTLQQPPEPCPGPASLRFGVVGLDIEGLDASDFVIDVDHAATFELVGRLTDPCQVAGCADEVEVVVDRLDDADGAVTVKVVLE